MVRIIPDQLLFSPTLVLQWSSMPLGTIEEIYVCQLLILNFAAYDECHDVF